MYKAGVIMSPLLTAVLEITTVRPILGSAIWVRFTIVNNFDHEVIIVNPEVGIPPPELDWRGTEQAYQVAVLMSFGLIRITLKHTDGQLVESKGLVPWVTPTQGKRPLQPHDNLVMDFELNELFSINLAGPYNLQVRYGKHGAFADASTDIEILPNP